MAFEDRPCCYAYRRLNFPKGAAGVASVGPANRFMMLVTLSHCLVPCILSGRPDLQLQTEMYAQLTGFCAHAGVRIKLLLISKPHQLTF